MKTAQYIRQEKAISTADTGGIRERWLWGLRLLRDPDAFAPGSSQMKPGRLDQMIKVLASASRPVSRREIQYRLQCARTYRTETEIAHACAQFQDWSELRAAGFPPYEAPEDEPPADHRNANERAQDRARAMADLTNDQDAFFPLSHFEPASTTLKELVAYADEQEAITARFAEHGRKRRTHLNRLVAVVDGDLSVVWKTALERLADAGDLEPSSTSA